MNARNLELYSVLEGARMGVAVISGRKLDKVNRHLAELLGYSPREVHALELPDLFSSPEDYREFARTLSHDKNAAGWHCSTHTLVTRNGPGMECSVMVRRLDGFDPLKGHLVIIEKIQDTAPAGPELREKMRSGSFEEIIAGCRVLLLPLMMKGPSPMPMTPLRTFGYQPGEMDGRTLTGTIVPEHSRSARLCNLRSAHATHRRDAEALPRPCWNIFLDRR